MADDQDGQDAARASVQDAGGGEPGGSVPSVVWLEIGEAAKRLGLSIEATRKRVRRRSLEAHKRDGRWYVVLPVQAGGPGRGQAMGRTAAQDAPPAAGQDAARTAGRDVPDGGQDAAIAVALAQLRTRVEEMERGRVQLVATIEDQRRRLDVAERERAELRQLLAAAISAVPQLAAGASAETTAAAPSTAPENGSADRSASPPSGAARTGSQPPNRGTPAPWWRRWWPSWT